MNNPWKAFEHRMRNQFPQNPTQTAYIRFQPSRFEMKPTPFDKSLNDLRRQQEDVFKTPYLDIIGDNNGRD